MRFGIYLGIGLFSGGAPAPALTSLDYDLADTAGGDSITITGTDLGSASSCTVGGTSATITANTDTSLTFTMPAKSAGTYDVVVTTAGGESNALSIEAWSFSSEASCTWFVEKPDYSVGANYLWTARVGANSTAAAGTTTPTATAGEPVFDGTDDFIGGPTMASLFDLSAPSAGSLVVVAMPTAAAAQGGTLNGYDNPMFLSTSSGSANFGLGYSNRQFTNSSVPGVEAVINDGSYKVLRCTASVSEMHAVLWRFADSDNHQLQVDGKKNDGTAGFESAAVGTINTTSAAAFVGKNYASNKFITGTIRAIAAFNVKVSDTVAAKILKLARVRYGVT